MATSTYFGWTEPDDTDLVKNGAAAMRTLGNAIDSSLYNAVGKAAGKNAVINGGFDIWQRGTSFTNPTSNATTYFADRMQYYRAGFAANITATQQNSALTGINKCARLQRTASDTSTAAINLVQSIESINSYQFAGQTVTFSFYLRLGSNFSGNSNNFYASIYSGTGTDQNFAGGFTGSTNVATTTFSTGTTTWQRFTVTGSVPTNATQLATLIAYAPTGTAGANDYFEITGVQLELGSSATPFSRAGGTIQGELAACQRYYFRTTGQIYSGMATGFATSTTGGLLFLQMPVSMRVAPTALEYGNVRVIDSGFAGTLTTLALTTQDSSNVIAELTVTGTGYTAHRPIWLSANNNAAGYVAVTAEL